MAVQRLDPEPPGVFVSGMCAAVFMQLLARPLRRRIAPSTGIDPRNRDELLSNFEELARVGRGWMRSRRPISVASQVSRSVTEIDRGSVVDMEINTEIASQMLRLSDSRIRQLLRSGELAGHKVGRRWLVKRSAMAAYAGTSRKAAA